MTRTKAGLLAFTVIVGVAASGWASAESLSDAIALAYQTNPALLAARADQRALDERYIQARDSLGPTASISEQRSNDAASVKQAGFTGTTTSRYRAATDSTQLTISQPLYEGGQLSTAITAARADVLGGRQALRQAEASLLGQVISAYCDVLLAQELVDISKQDVDILRRQAAETQAKVEVKDLTLTDQAQAAARLVAADIKLTQARNQLANAQTKYRAVVGQSPGQLDPVPDLPGLPPTLTNALDAADRANPELLSAAYAELSSRARVAQAKAADGLQVGFSLSVSQQPLAPYLDHQDVRSVIGAVVVEKPLFTSGLHSSRVRAAIETNNRDDLKLADGRRQITAAVVQAWNNLAAQRQILIGLNRQLGDEQGAFDGSRIEARLGLRTTIDVLNAEQELQATKVSLVQVYHDEYLTRVNLLADMGLLQAELLDPDIDPYRPEQSLNRRDALARALPWEGLVAALDSIGAPSTAVEPLDRDPLGDLRPEGDAPMPGAPRWSDLAKNLDVPSIEVAGDAPLASSRGGDLDGLRPEQSPTPLAGYARKAAKADGPRLSAAGDGS